jgi:hypothetical protein
MAEPASEFHHGDQDISEQVNTYRTFGALTKWFCLGLGALIVMLVMWFCTNVGFLGGLFTGVVITVAGIIFLRGPSDTEVGSH